ncbi:MAG: hypothetical protein ACLU4N_02790 [Butyricimonas faecihominis]
MIADVKQPLTESELEKIDLRGPWRKFVDCGRTRASGSNESFGGTFRVQFMPVFWYNLVGISIGSDSG